MKARKKLITSAASLFLVFCLVGCGAEHSALQYFADEDTAGSAETEEDMESLQNAMESFVGEDVYEQNFIKPNVVSNIYIDTQGYDAQDIKLAYFESDSLSSQQEFSVYEKDSGKLVYTGEMVKTKGYGPDGETVYRGDFSDVTLPGAYYIQTAVIGRSYDFVIEKNHYNVIKEKLRQSFLQTGSEEYFALEEGTETEEEAETTEGLYGFLQMSIAWELSPECFNDAMAQKLCEHARWLLEWKEEADKQKKQFSAQEYYLLSACFAQFCVSVKETDTELYNLCLKAARATYGQVTQTLFSEGDNEAAQYMAAAALYKAAGNASYHTVIKNFYKNKESAAAKTDGDSVSSKPRSGSSISGNAVSDNTVSDNTVSAEEETFVLAKEQQRSEYQNFLAEFFYMTTEKSTDFNMCGKMMSQFMSQCAGYLSSSADSALGLTTGSDWQGDILPDDGGWAAPWSGLRSKTVLQHGIQLAVADYAIVGREYRNACKQQLHYVLNNTETDMTDLPQDSQSAVWLILCMIL